MPRGRARKRDDRAQVAASLAAHGVDRGFAIRVAEKFVSEGPCAARVLLYAGGWEPYVEFRDVDGARVKTLSVRRVLTTKG